MDAEGLVDHLVSDGSMFVPGRPAGICPAMRSSKTCVPFRSGRSMWPARVDSPWTTTRATQNPGDHRPELAS
ncbi:hypothetical protein BZL29_2280 [Mycobacterium kansasii]|uniref:Uncharacterized protein n=1 Tax=Mycobacterium kansasii TaxID=1768 RepID=A0A1V3XP14_MYCKA|nr:hypothetical protein BZL29_2280 [Mycobacterium kansasii]